MGDLPANETSVTASHNPPRLLTPGQIFRISALWFALQFFWATQQLAVMPDMVRHFWPEDKVFGWYYTLIKSVGAIFVLITQLTVGFLSDHAYSRMGRRRPFIVIGITSGCAAIVLFMLAPTYWWLFAGYMLIEVTINIASVPFQSLLPDLVPKRQHAQAGSLMGLLHMAGYLISLVVLAVSGLFIGDALLVYRTILLPVFIVLLLVFMSWTVLGIDEHGWAQTARGKLEGALRTVRLFPGTVARFVASAPTLFGCMVSDYRKVELRTQPNYVYLWLSRFVVFLGYATFIQWSKLYIDSNLDWAAWATSLGIYVDPDDKAPLFVASAIFACFVLGGLFGSRIAGPLADRFSKKAVIAGGLIIAFVADIPLILITDMWWACGCGMVIGFGWGAFISADWAFACTLIPKKKAGSYMGIWDISTLLPQVISPAIGGFLYQSAFAFYATGGTNLLAIFSRDVPATDPVAAAAGFKCVIASLVAYFIIGLWVLRFVREERTAAEPAEA